MNNIIKRSQLIIEKLYSVVLLRSKKDEFAIIEIKPNPILKYFNKLKKAVQNNKNQIKIKINKLHNTLIIKLKGNADCEELSISDEKDTIRLILKKKIIKKTKKWIKQANKKVEPYKQKLKQKIGTYKKVLVKLKTEFKKIVTDKLVIKMGIVVVFILIMANQSFSWFYNEYIGNGALFDVGTIISTVKQYDEEGTYIQEVENPSTIVYEANMSNTTTGTKFLEVTNDGTLDMEYDITFQLDGTVGNAGVMYYRLFDVTSAVEASVVDELHPTKLEEYAYNNPIDPDIEEDTGHPISNMTTIGSYVKNGVIHVENESTDSNPRYYRIDYGMYEAVNSSLYSGESIAAHISVYATQIGLLEGGSSSETYTVSTETEFRDAVNTALSGDTIRLSTNISIAGSIDFSKSINIDTNEHTLAISGDLVYDYVEIGSELLIDVGGEGKLEIGNDFYINTPKTKVHLLGDNKAYDIFVGNEMTVSGLQDGEEEGFLIDATNIVKSTSTYVPVDLLVKSNIRLVIGLDVIVGLITAIDGATNIELINNGKITQVQLQEMTLLTTFTKPQIYIYNLDTIYGVMGGSSILLPSNATPYVSPTQGNTLIIRGINSNDITVDGSDYFDEDDIQENETDESVQPIAGETEAYTVYLSEAGATIEAELETYFTQNNYFDVPAAIAAIQKLVIVTTNGQYMNNVDFDFLKSSDIPIISHLGLENARVKDDTVLNQIKASALSGKTSLLTVVLPETVTAIGDNAFYNVGLGVIPANIVDPFNMLSIPASVTSIGTGAFNATKYISFEGLTPPTIASGTFNTAANGAKIFVSEAVIPTYQAETNLNSSNIYQAAYASDNRLYFVFDSGAGIGIAYYVNDTTEYTSVNIPTELDVDSYTLAVNAIGSNAYRHIVIDSGGADLALPTTVTEVDAYAFYDLNITSANFGNLVTVGDYSFYSVNVESITANSITTIGDHAFELTTAETASFTSLTTMGSYALASSPDLYEVKLGDVTSIGEYALYDCKNLSRVYFETTTTKMVGSVEEIDITVGSNATFSNWGYYIDDRLRVYVPDGTTSEDNTYLELYKAKFSSNADYIFVTGSSNGSYYYYSVPYDLTNYTLREVTIDDYQDTPVTGWEIISYQGADLTSSYQLPTSLTVGETTHNVISIGEGAYKNAVVTTGQTVDLSNSNLLNIADYAFYGLNINSITANNVVTLGDYALATTGIISASFDHLSVINDYALYDNDDLYSVNLGNAQILGTDSVANNPNLERVYFTNDDLNTLLVGTPFSGSGTSSGDRLRIYVPNGDTYINYYKSVLDTPDYVYGTGSVVGSYTDGNGHEIGAYTIRAVTKNNYSGTPITGWEIIEYHGADLTDAYTIPTTFTVGATTYDVISIGRDAYINTTVTAENELTLTNTYLINIGDNAFDNLQGIDTISASGVVTIGESAFDGTTLTAGTFAHLNSLEATAFANDDTLYYLHLGTVKTMAENAVYNLDKLSQVYFTATDTSLSFDTDAITDIGSLTNSRLRLYVTDGSSSGGTPWVDVYKALFSSAYIGYWYREGSIVGSYSQTNIPFDIGNYTVREVTLDDYESTPVTGWELIEYHGTNLIDAYNFPTSVTVGEDTYNIISIGEYAYYHTASVEDITMELSSTYILKIGKYAFYEVDGLYSITTNNVTTINEQAFRYTNLVSASFTHLATAGDYALANITSLNMINLGSCGTLGDGLLYNDESIEQLFMTNTDYGSTQMNITIGTDAFYGVATTIGNRVRVYVPDGIATGSTTYVTLYKATLPSGINPYVYATGSLYGTYTASPEPYDIAQYMVKEVTINGNNGWEIIDYHGADVTSTYTIPSSFTINSVTKDVVSVGEYAYRFTSVASGETWNLNLPTTITNIGTYAFYQRSIIGVSGNIMFSIGTYAFAQCPGLAAVDFVETRTIGGYAFYLNTALAYVSVGIGGTNYGNYAFYQEASTNVLAEFRVMNTTPPTIYAYTLPPNTGTIKPTIYVPDTAYSAYNSATYWKNYTRVRVNTPYLGVWNYSIINTNEIHIISYVGKQQTADIPDYFTLDGDNYNVTSLGASAFPAVQTRYIDIPRYMVIINVNVLGNTKRVNTFTVDANNTTFSATNGVLFNYDGTVLIKYPDGKTGSSYTIPSGTTAIASTAFAYNTSLTTLSFPSSLVVISHDAFTACTNMRTYNFAGTTPPILPGFIVFPYYSNMYLNVPSAAEATYEAHYAYYYYRARIFGV